jgi:hypothetical protein
MEFMIFLIVASYFIVFGLGYFIAKIQKGISIQINQQMRQEEESVVYEKPKAFLSQIEKPKEEKIIKRKIEIDDRKFITEIKTDTLEKKFDELTTTTVSKDENLSSNVNKLASLKKSKEK